MTILKIVEHPHPVLETECEPVKTFDKNLKTLVKDMFETMYEAEGVGLAAPQVGIAEQIAVVDIGDDTGQLVLINPVIKKASGSQSGPEGCLSFPGLFGEVERPFEVIVTAYDVNGKEFTLKASDFLARAIQHEIDHLHGILFTSKVIEYYETEELEG
ncbi:peptide deformylase [Fictibacillus sp. 5RED26]|jgi:peptide deformylase|uniref:peptide deformylase n=1 Tax=Fictibacillus TaxID=1329200 RepID=UPI0018CFBDAB|nr:MULTISPECIES: peptide deformylase [unclassified Fictibacillus]MBH0155828.1 peptide deformylase [Fictibacillus sp. 5RED26]MBH0165930.1 peptide deformylase [Fictibacillus sp. 7GRE50]